MALWQARRCNSPTFHVVDFPRDEAREDTWRRCRPERDSM
jgi:hypothetical protein